MSSCGHTNLIYSREVLLTAMPGPSREVTRDDVLEMMTGRSSKEWSVEELARDIGCSNSTVYNRLRELYTLGEIDTRKNGQNRYWWVAGTKTEVEA